MTDSSGIIVYLQDNHKQTFISLYIEINIKSITNLNVRIKTIRSSRKNLAQQSSLPSVGQVFLDTIPKAQSVGQNKIINGFH